MDGFTGLWEGRGRDCEGTDRSLGQVTGGVGSGWWVRESFRVRQRLWTSKGVVAGSGRVVASLELTGWGCQGWEISERGSDEEWVDGPQDGPCGVCGSSHDRYRGLRGTGGVGWGFRACHCVHVWGFGVEGLTCV